MEQDLSNKIALRSALYISALPSVGAIQAVMSSLQLISEMSITTITDN